jgi:hypothetical protein
VARLGEAKCDQAQTVLGLDKAHLPSLDIPAMPMKDKPGGWMIPDIMEVNNLGTVTREVVETARERWSWARARPASTVRTWPVDRSASTAAAAVEISGPGLTGSSRKPARRSHLACGRTARTPRTDGAPCLLPSSYRSAASRSFPGSTSAGL